QRRARAVAAPIRHAKIRAASDDGRSQMLIADEREVRRIGDAAASRLVAVTTGARAGKNLATAPGVAGLSACTVIWGNSLPADGVRSPPAILDPADEDLDLLIRERATGSDRKRWLRGARDADGDHLAETLARHEGEVDRIVQRARRAQAAGLAVTSGA